MKTEQALLKNPVEPLAVLPEARVSGFPGAGVRTRHGELKYVAPSVVIPTVYADIPPSVYATLILCWAALMSVFWLTFAESPNAAFMVAISTAFGVMFFGVPIAANRIGYRRPWSGPGLTEFLHGKVQTLYGPVNGFDALAQVILVPVCLTIGAAIISFIINLDRMPN